MKNLKSSLPSKVLRQSIKPLRTTTFTGVILVIPMFVAVTTQMTAVGHGLQPILTVGKVTPLIVVVTITLCLIQMIISSDSHARMLPMESATLCIALVSIIVAGHTKKEIQVSGLATLLHADATLFPE